MINLPRGPGLARFLVSASAALAISALAAPGGGTTPGGYDPTRPLGDTNRYTHPYSIQNLGAAGAAYLQVNNFYEGVAGWDEWGKLYAFPTIASANGGTESSITGTLTIRYMRGYGPTADSYAPENVWTVGTIKGQTEYVASAADYPAVLSDAMFTKSNPIPVGMHKFLRVWVISSNGSIPAATGIRAGTLEGSDSTPAANATSNYWNMTVWANRGRVNLNGGNAYGPCASFSRGPAGRVVFLELGDSKLYGDAGTNFNSFENGVRGWFRRSLNTLPAGQRRFALSLSVPGANPGAYVRNPDLTRGETPAKFAGKIASMKMLPEPPFTHIFNQHALNAGFGNLNTLFSDNMLEYFLKIRSFFPGIPIHAATVPACFNGMNCTDGYETQAGMPANPAFYPGGTFYEYNEALKSGKFASLVDKVVDIAAAFNGTANDPINPDPYKPRVYSGPISDTVLVDSTNNNKIRLSNPAQWDRGMSIMIDPLGLAKTGTPVGVINSFAGDDFSLQYSSGGSAGALIGMKAQPRYLVDKLHNTKEGDDLQIPTTVTYALTVTA